MSGSAPRSTDSLARRIITKLGVNPDQLRERVAQSVARTPKLGYGAPQIFQTPRIVSMLEAANAEADRLRDEFIGVEHILLAIVDERDGESARILKEAGIDKERLYRALQEVRGNARVDSPRAESHYQALEK